METAVKPTPGSVQRDSMTRIPRVPDPTPTGGNFPLRSVQKEGKEKVAELAYSIWQQRGCPENCADEIWLEAERKVNRG
jgi:hypothetical protein